MKGTGGKDLVTQSEGARRLGMTPQAIGVWASRAGAPVEGVGAKRRLIWPDFPKWRDAELARQIREEAKAAAKPGDFDEARTRKMAAEAELAEHELAKQRGDLITLADAEKEAELVFDRLRARLVAIPTKEAHRVVGLKKLPEATRVLRDIVDRILAEMSSTDMDLDEAA